jgi:hypothetical protein
VAEASPARLFCSRSMQQFDGHPFIWEVITSSQTLDFMASFSYSFFVTIYDVNR